MQLICETLFPPRMSVTTTFLTYSSYTKDTRTWLYIAVNSYIHSSLLIYCTSVWL